jgi:DNA-binding CsgD family transcriptional regulator
MVPVHGTELRLPTPAGTRPRVLADGATGHAVAGLFGALGLALLFYEEEGRMARESRAATSLLRADAEEDRLRSAARRLAVAVREGAGRRRGTAATEVVTANGRYSLRAAAVPAALLGGGVTALVALTMHAPAALTDGQLRDRFALTPRQVEVARLMARGLTNADIGLSLVISHHTAERHAERVLRKLRVATRSAVAAFLNLPNG